MCSRLGLVSLAYLWHQPQEQLLSDMIANDIEAVLVKVSAFCVCVGGGGGNSGGGAGERGCLTAYLSHTV